MIRGVAVDLDPREAEEKQPGGFERERERLLAIASGDWAGHVIAEPSAVIDSGNGVQLVWLFPEPLPNTEANKAAVKAQAKGLAELLEGDAVQSLEHLFRVPFTENLPNAKKRDKGRAKSTARLLNYNSAARISLAGLAMVATPIHEQPAAKVDLDDFDYNAVVAAAEDALDTASRADGHRWQDPRLGRRSHSAREHGPLRA